MGLALLALLSSRFARAESLADAAERFAETSLSLPKGSVKAHSIDRRVSLGECAAGWNWSFPYENRTTVRVSCKNPVGGSEQSRFVLLHLSANPGAEAPFPGTPLASGKMLVADRDLPVGQLLAESDLTLVDIPAATRLRAGQLSDPALVVGQTLTRSLRRGEPIGPADARFALIVRRNTLVSGWTEFAGGKVIAKLTALQDGKAGDWINLENPQSSRKLRGQVQRDGSVRLGVRSESQSISLASAKEVGITAD